MSRGLRDRRFERSVKRRVRAEIRASPALRREYRASRTAWWRRHYNVPGLWRFLILFILAFNMGLARRATLDFILGLAVLWLVTSICFRAVQLLGTLYQSPRLNVFNHLPIADGDVFTEQWRQFLRRTLWSALDALVIFGALGFKLGFGPSALWIGAVVAVVMYMFIAAESVCLFAFGPRRFLFLLTLLSGALLIEFLFLGTSQPDFAAWLARMAFWIPPLGWVLQTIKVPVSTGPAHVLTPILETAVVLALAPAAYRLSRKEYVLGETEFSSARRSNAPGPSGSPEMQGLAQRFADEPDAIESEIRQGNFLRGVDWAAMGFVEGLLSLFLTQRERLVAEFLVGGSPRWTKGLKGFCVLIGISLGTCWLVARRVPIDPALLVITGLVIAVFAFLGSWRGTGMPVGGGLQSPLYASYPIAFWELARVMLKVNAVRLLLYLPLIAGGIGLFIALLYSGNRIPIGMAAKMILLGFLIQPLLVIIPISQGTDDTRRVRVMLLVIVGTVAFIGTVGAFLFAEGPWLVAGGLGSALIPILALLLYGRMFNRNRFDLVPLAPTTLAHTRV